VPLAAALEDLLVLPGAEEDQLAGMPDMNQEPVALAADMALPEPVPISLERVGPVAPTGNNDFVAPSNGVDTSVAIDCPRPPDPARCGPLRSPSAPSSATRPGPSAPPGRPESVRAAGDRPGRSPPGSAGSIVGRAGVTGPGRGGTWVRRGPWTSCRRGRPCPGPGAGVAARGCPGGQVAQLANAEAGVEQGPDDELLGGWPISLMPPSLSNASKPAVVWPSESRWATSR
jgi:hypothetical protein